MLYHESAVFLECGVQAPLFSFGDRKARKRRVNISREIRESGVRTPHSI
jgi:hypothetical protein